MQAGPVPRSLRHRLAGLRRVLTPAAGLRTRAVWHQAVVGPCEAAVARMTAVCGTAVVRLSWRSPPHAGDHFSSARTCCTDRMLSVEPLQTSRSLTAGEQSIYISRAKACHSLVSLAAVRIGACLKASGDQCRSGRQFRHVVHAPLD